MVSYYLQNKVMFSTCLSVCVLDNFKNNKQAFLKFFMLVGLDKGRTTKFVERPGLYS